MNSKWLLATVLLTAVGCGGGSPPPPAEEKAPADVPAAPPAEKPATETAPPAQTGSNPMVEMRTSLGTMKIELYPDKAPKTVENFLQYVRDGFYDGTVFHRVIEGFMIQGGGFTPDMTEKETRPPIQNEASNGLKNVRGRLEQMYGRDHTFSLASKPGAGTRIEVRLPLLPSGLVAAQ